MMTEIVNPSRLERAEWQRTLGAAACRAIGDHVFGPGPVDMPDATERVNIDARALRNYQEVSIPNQWYKLHAITMHTMQGRLATAPKLPPEVEQGLTQHTHYGANDDPERVFTEALEAQVHIPLIFAQVISHVAAARQVRGFSTDGPGEVAQLMDRSDFRTIINTALIAPNGEWDGISVSPGVSSTFMEEGYHGPVNTRAKDIAQSLVFDSGQNVSLSDESKRGLQQRLRSVNQQRIAKGPSSGKMSDRDSSGCPARHERVATLLHDSDALQALAKTFNTSVHELTTRREQSIVQDGLDYTVDLLANLEDYLSGRKTTYSGSAR